MSLNPNKIISLQELINAQVDAYKLELIMNEAPWIEVTTRLGRKCYSIATIQGIIDQYKILVDKELDNLKEVIEIAAAAGAGANGWVDSLVQTWSGRTQESKNKDSIHVLDFKYKDGAAKSDQETIQDAINYCIANNRTLNWEGANLISTENITNFWDVKHKGQGSIIREGYKFNITPILAQVSEIHIGATVLTANDGLSPNQATSITSALKYLATLGERASDGFWKVRFHGTTKTAGAHCPDLPRFRNPIEFCGEDVAVGTTPTSVWDGTGQATYAINFSKIPCEINITNLKLQNWTRTDGNAGGFVFDNNNTVYANNCHFIDMNIGIWTQISYLNVQNCRFENIKTFGCSVSYNGYGNVGVAGAGNVFKNCNTGVSVGRGAICYVVGNTFEDINWRAIEANKNARVRERGNTYVNYADGFDRQCCVLVEEGAVFNNDNNSGMPSTITANLTSDKPFLRLQSGAKYLMYTPKNGEGLHSSAALDQQYLLNTNDLVSLNTIFDKRMLSLPAYALYAPSFKIRFVLYLSLPGATTVQFKLNGQGESSTLTFGTFTLPTVETATNFVLEVVYEKMEGSDIIHGYASAPRLNYYSAISRNSSVLSQSLVRNPSEGGLIFRPYLQRTAGINSLNVFACKVYLEI